MCVIMTAKIWEWYGGKNPPKGGVRKSSNFIGFREPCNKDIALNHGSH